MKQKPAGEPHTTISYVDVLERVGGGVSVEQGANWTLKQIREMVATVGRTNDGPGQKPGRRRARHK